MLQHILILFCVFSLITAECKSSDIRFGGDLESSSGLLEQCNTTTDEWHGVCGLSFSCRDAKVACRQGGYNDVISYNNIYTSWPGEKTEYGLYSCTGSETSLLDCPPDTYWRNRYDIDQYCNTRRVTVDCIQSAGENCSTENDVRLVGGSSEYEGQLQICKNKIWRDVCQSSNRYLQYLGPIVCKHLGYTDPYISVSDTGYFYNSTDREYYSRLNCYGTYYQLSWCNAYSDCVQCKGREVSVKCKHEPTDCQNGTVRLVGGSYDLEGSLEICHNGIWGGISNNIEGNTKEVACAALGFNGTGATINTYHNYKKNHAPLLVEHINCCNDDKKIMDCDIKYVDYSSGSVNHNAYTIGLRCTDGCTNGEMRLVGGQTSNEGVVQVCIDAIWTLVPLDSWNDEGAHVVCRNTLSGQKFSSAVALNSSYFEKPNRPIRYRYRCNGHEKSLYNCNRYWYYGTQDEIVAAVQCGCECSTGEETEDRRRREATDEENSQKENEYASGENHVVAFSALGMFAGGSIFGILVSLSVVQVTRIVLKKAK